MPHTFTCLLVHVIFSTKDRAPDLSPELAARLFPYMGRIVRECVDSRNRIDSRHLEGAESQFLSLGARAVPERKRFGWQAGYGAFTVSGSRSDDVRNYIASQEAHHRKVSFQEEFLTLLRKHGLEYDARDVWG